MIKIRNVYKEYNPDGEYLSLAIIGDILLAYNMEDEGEADHPLDIYYIIK